MTARLERRFAALRMEGRAGLVTFVTAGDPDLDTSARILAGLPAAGADVIEFGMPFTDPMADGPSVQAAGVRALKAGTTLKKTLAMVREFRRQDDDTPIILMGYFNPIHNHGVDAFVQDALAAGIDGLIVVDLPAEEDDELCLQALGVGLNFIRMATPTTSDQRLPAVLANTTGFIYYVSYTGITGARQVDADAIKVAVARLKKHSDLPIAVGFGIRTPEQAAAVAKVADAVVIGSAFVDQVRDNPEKADTAVLDLVGKLADAVRSARR